MSCDVRTSLFKSYSIAGVRITVLTKNIFATDGLSPTIGFNSLTQSYLSPLYVVYMSASCKVTNEAHCTFVIGSTGVNCNSFFLSLNFNSINFCECSFCTAVTSEG